MSGVSKVGALLGREEELARARAWLDEPAPHPVVITGPPGVGKSALAAALTQGRDPVAFVELSGCASPIEGVERIGAALGAAWDAERGLEAGGLAALLDRRERSTLVLDGLEALADGFAAEADRWLWPRPGHRVLCTSRRDLGLRGPRLRLRPLPVGPEPLASPAGRLLCARAELRPSRLSEDQRAELGRIVEQLGGLPLALELAAPRLQLLGVDAFGSRMGDPWSLLASPDGDRPLEDAFAATWRDLSLGGRRLVAALAACPGAPEEESVAQLLPEAGGGFESRESRSALAELVERGLVHASGGRLHPVALFCAFAAREEPELAAQMRARRRARLLAEAAAVSREPRALSALDFMTRHRAELEALFTRGQPAELETEALARLLHAWFRELRLRAPAATRARVVLGVVDGLAQRLRRDRPALLEAARDEAAEALQAARDEGGGADPLPRELAPARQPADGGAGARALRALRRGDPREAEAALGPPLPGDVSWREASLRARIRHDLGELEDAAEWTRRVRHAAEREDDPLGALRATALEAQLAACREGSEALGRVVAVAHRASYLRARRVAFLASLRAAELAWIEGDREAEAEWTERARDAAARLGGLAERRLELTLGWRQLAEAELEEAERLLRMPDEVAPLLLGWLARGGRVLIAGGRGRSERVALELDEWLEATPAAPPLRELASLVSGVLDGAEREGAEREGADRDGADRDGDRPRPERWELRWVRACVRRHRQSRVLESEEPRSCLIVGPACRWARVGDRPIDLHQRPVLQRILSALVDAAERGRELDTEALWERGWPGETAALASRRNRVYDAIRRLRRLGLGELVERDASGYRLASGLGLVRRTGAGSGLPPDPATRPDPAATVER